MLTFRVEGMTCGHCATAVTKALKTVDRDAKVSIDLDMHLVVHVEAAKGDAQSFHQSLAEAGYAPTSVEMHRASALAAGTAGGCCCGSGASRAVDGYQYRQEMKRASSKQPEWSRA